MAVIRTKPYVVGDTAYLAPANSTAQWVHVVAPDGSEAKYRRTGSAPVELTLDQAGPWTYQWGQSDQGSFEVVAVQTDQPESPPRPAPPVSVGPRWGPAKGV